jgi:hypothetical protein
VRFDKKRTAKAVYRVKCKKVPCAICRAFPGKTHSKVFAVRFLFFAGKGHVSRSVHAPSARQLADVFTKGLPSSLLLDFRDSLCVTNTVEPPGGWGGGG